MTFRALTDFSASDGSHADGDEWDADYDYEEETRLLDEGLMEVVPVAYRVIGEAPVLGTAPGGTFTGALTPGQRLLVGTHIEEVDLDAVDEPEPAEPAEPETEEE